MLATDISPQMLAIATQRAAALGLHNIIEFKDGDAETLELQGYTLQVTLEYAALLLLGTIRYH